VSLTITVFKGETTMKTIAQLVLAATVLFGATAGQALAQNENVWNGNKFKTQQQINEMHSGNGSLSGN
jgi:hypothetical protein